MQKNEKSENSIVAVLPIIGLALLFFGPVAYHVIDAKYGTKQRAKINAEKKAFAEYVLSEIAKEIDADTISYSDSVKYNITRLRHDSLNHVNYITSKSKENYKHGKNFEKEMARISKDEFAACVYEYKNICRKLKLAQKSR